MLTCSKKLERDKVSLVRHLELTSQSLFSTSRRSNNTNGKSVSLATLTKLTLNFILCFFVLYQLFCTKTLDSHTNKTFQRTSLVALLPYAWLNMTYSVLNSRIYFSFSDVRKNERSEIDTIVNFVYRTNSWRYQFLTVLIVLLRNQN